MNRALQFDDGILSRADALVNYLYHRFELPRIMLLRICLVGYVATSAIGKLAFHQKIQLSDMVIWFALLSLFFLTERLNRNKSVELTNIAILIHRAKPSEIMVRFFVYVLTMYETILFGWVCFFNPALVPEGFVTMLNCLLLVGFILGGYTLAPKGPPRGKQKKAVFNSTLVPVRVRARS
jgi:hypothetical protein